MPTYKIREAVIAPGSYATLPQHCADEDHALSGGERAEDGTAAIVLRDTFPQDTAGDADLEPEDQFLVNVENRDSTPVQVKAWVICANPGPVQIESATLGGPLVGCCGSSRDAKCPAHTHAYGGGIEAGVNIRLLYPGKLAWSKERMDSGWAGATTSSQQPVDSDLTVYAVCGPSVG